ncbi:hypothetical protein Tco_1259576, partial [Tanacetum coccineum]
IKEVAALTLVEYNEAIEEEVKFLFQRAKFDWLSEGDKNTAYFHKVVKSRRNRNRVMSITDALGKCVEGSKIADEFVGHFENFLGLNTHVHHLDSLGNIFTTTLTSNEANAMVAEIFDHEIKMAMFGIDDCKAPGPDGRNIQDNILLTQELLKGYNKKGGAKRCALKIDITKAYDTGSEIRGSYLSLPFHFSNEGVYIDIGSENSFKAIKESLNDFSKVSGLEPNMNKSTIFFMPLITKRLSREECKQLLDKVKNKVGDWKNKFLYYARRVQLIASVLGSIQIYWASVFQLPKTTLKDIERILKGFLWCQGDLARGKAKIAWKTLCKPKCQGGLGFKDLGRWNEIWQEKWNSIFPEICNIQVPTLSNNHDKTVWRCNDGSLKYFLVKQTWEDYKEIHPEVS